MFFLKKLISRFLFPVPITAELLVVGLLLLLFTKRKKLGQGLLIAGTALLLAISLPWGTASRLKPLERTYPAVLDPRKVLQDPKASNVWIAVMGQGVSANTSLPPNARFNREFVPRLLEAGRLQRLLPGSKILVSVSGKAISEEDKLQVLTSFYGLLGILPGNLILYGNAKDSIDEIQYFKQQAGTNQVFLVSSAFHLRRCMVLAKRYGLNATPVPASYLTDIPVDHVSPFNPAGVFPSADNVRYTERVTYEYLGLLYEKLRGRLSQAESAATGP